MAAAKWANGSLWLGASHRSAAGSAHPPCPRTGDERRELPAEAQPRECRAPISGRPGRRLTSSTTQPANILRSCLQLSMPSQLPPCWWSTILPPQWPTLTPPITPGPEASQVQGATAPDTHPHQRALWYDAQQAKLRGLSLRAMARELGIHRNTVRLYVLAKSPPVRKKKAQPGSNNPRLYILTQWIFSRTS